MSSLNFHDRDLLEAVVSMEEVKDLLKSDIHEFVTTFFNTGSMPLGSNSSCITIIPKVSNPIHINDFRPISLMGTHYKIIAKILANRSSNVVDNLVSHEQSSFTSGRQILDGPLMLNEMIDYLGFGVKWRSWIKACLKSLRTSILVNGSPTSEFIVKRGLRQGGTLSTFLFILVMEGLHVAFKDAVQSGLIRGIKIGNSDITLSYLFYADDVTPLNLSMQRNNNIVIGTGSTIMVTTGNVIVTTGSIVITTGSILVTPGRIILSLVL
ncbi:putative RNA-directed DNA polymerase, eukaryota, reverse transcriptase zinc-binding domain protein, partial [Tanacetum coccineum]